jgi:hypothetical protein
MIGAILVVQIEYTDKNENPVIKSIYSSFHLELKTNEAVDEKAFCVRILPKYYLFRYVNITELNSHCSRWATHDVIFVCTHISIKSLLLVKRERFIVNVQ